MDTFVGRMHMITANRTQQSLYLSKVLGNMPNGMVIFVEKRPCNHVALQVCIVEKQKNYRSRAPAARLCDGVPVLVEV